MWLFGGREVRRVLRADELPTVFEPAFVRRAAANPALTSARPPVNPTFHLTARPQVSGLTPEQQARLTTVAVLGVQQVRFEPGSTQLSAAARQDIEEFVVPALRSSVGTYLRVEGSAGWPAGAGLNEAVVNALAFERARAVQDLLARSGIPAERLILGTSLPRCRDCQDAAAVQRDDRVVFTLVTA